MKKLITKTLAILILLTTFSVPIASAEFSDVSASHKNYDAIIYLQQNGIIDGYADGTFKPYNQVNRAEFLKIILEGSNIPLDIVTNTPFPDVDHTAWYGPYLKKAYATGWIDGYPDDTFKPEQTINKAEALKILGEVQNWATPDSPGEAPFEDTPKFAWYTKYVAYAKDHNYLEETGTIFFPDTLMTRANISEIIYRTLVIEDEQDDTDTSDTTDDEEPEEITFTPVTYNSISKNFYEKITLDESLPNTFYKNEVYIIKGEVTSGSYTKATILLDSSKGSDQTIFAEDVEDNEFEISVYFTESGNYHLGIMPGEEGETKTKKISVLPSLPESSEEESLTSTADSLSIDFANDRTFVEFSAPSLTIKKLYFTQDNEKVTYISRQNIDSISINYSDFEEFEEGEVSYYIKTAKLSSKKPLTLSSNFTTSSSKKFDAVEHTYDSIAEGAMSGSPPDRLASIQPISFIGSLNADTQTRAYVIKPNGSVDEITLSTVSSTTTYFGNTIILSGGDFQFEYSPSSTGRYIIEIIDKDGIPLINHPVYIGDIIPLIPDYFDLHERDLFTGAFDLENFREDLLQEINKSRAEHGLEEVIMSEELNQIAQAHSNDMATNNFFSHINLNNETPEDRRIDASIATPVSENIAMDVSIIFGHLGLMRSASHRDNILGEDWIRVGLGITLDEGYFFITEEFSTSELTQGDLESFKNNLFSGINTKRINNSVAALTYNNSLEMASIYLNNKVIQEGASLTNSVFQEALETYNITGASQAMGRTYNIWSKILSSILEEETTIVEAVWKKIGIDIQTDSTGNIHTIFILN